MTKGPHELVHTQFLKQLQERHECDRATIAALKAALKESAETIDGLDASDLADGGQCLDVETSRYRAMSAPDWTAET